MGASGESKAGCGDDPRSQGSRSLHQFASGVLIIGHTYASVLARRVEREARG